MVAVLCSAAVGQEASTAGRAAGAKQPLSCGDHSVTAFCTVQSCWFSVLGVQSDDMSGSVPPPSPFSSFLKCLCSIWCFMLPSSREVTQCCWASNQSGAPPLPAVIQCVAILGPPLSLTHTHTPSLSLSHPSRTPSPLCLSLTHTASPSPCPCTDPRRRREPPQQRPGTTAGASPLQGTAPDSPKPSPLQDKAPDMPAAAAAGQEEGPQDDGWQEYAKFKNMDVDRECGQGLWEGLNGIFVCRVDHWDGWQQQPGGGAGLQSMLGRSRTGMR